MKGKGQKHRSRQGLGFDSQASVNRRGEPLVSFQTVVNLISATPTRRGLRVKAVLDKGPYETGVKISDEQMKGLNIRAHSQNPEWTYLILPRGN